MAARTRVVITTVGPYTRYGLPLVAACAGAGTDYADLTGESPFIRSSIDLYHKQAVDTGARIVHSCGFDSVPSDLSVYALYRAAGEDGAGELVDTDFVVRSMSGGLSGGTIASLLEVLHTVSSDPDMRRQFADPYTLSPDRGAEPELGAQPDLPWRRGRQIAPELTGVWTAGFMMAPANTRIVRRSNALLDWAYGRRFRYSESMSLGSSVAAPVASAVVNGVGNADVRTRQPLFPATATWTGGACRSQTRHRPERGGPRARLLPHRDLHHHDQWRPVCGAHGAGRRPGIQGDLGPAGRVWSCAGVRP